VGGGRGVGRKGSVMSPSENSFKKYTEAANNLNTSVDVAKLADRTTCCFFTSFVDTGSTCTFRSHLLCH